MNIDYSKQHKQFVIFAVKFADRVRVGTSAGNWAFNYREVSHATWEKYQTRLERSKQQYHVS